MLRAPLLVRTLLAGALVLAGACSDDDSDVSDGETTTAADAAAEDTTTTTVLELDDDDVAAAEDALDDDAVSKLRADHEEQLAGVDDGQLARLAAALCLDDPPGDFEAVALAAGVEDPHPFLIVGATAAARVVCPDALGEAGGTEQEVENETESSPSADEDEMPEDEG